MNINNLNYKDNLTYKDNLNCNNSNSILNSKSLILNYPINPPVSKADIPPYKGGQGGFTLLKRFNCNLIFNFPFSIFNFKAFSLIELSIVLIIIGLLIAGITGGASLIQSAKVRSLINEIKDYERAVYTFQAARGRYPGDVKNYGTFGNFSNYYEPASTSSSYARPGYAYKASDFSSELLAEFQKTAGSNAIPDRHSAPFLELYNDGIIEFKPLGNAMTSNKNSSKKATPSLKVEPNNYLYFVYTGTFYLGKPCERSVDGCIYNKGLTYNGQIKEALASLYQDYSATRGFDPKFLKAVDEKMDDGWYSTGVVRSGCYGSSNSHENNSYENAIANGKKCATILYAI